MASATIRLTSAFLRSAAQRSIKMVANPAANLQHNTSWTTRGALGRLAASMPMWKMRSAAKRSVKTAATPAVKTAATPAATRGPTSGAEPDSSKGAQPRPLDPNKGAQLTPADSNKGAQLRPTPGSKPRNSETKGSRSATWSSETEDSQSAAWNSETLDLHSVAEARESKDSGTCTACNGRTKGPERTGRQPSYRRGR